LRAVTWSVSFWESIQRKLLTWPQVLVSGLCRNHTPTLYCIWDHVFSLFCPPIPWMLLFLASFLQQGFVGLSLNEFPQIRALGECLIFGPFLSNLFLGIIVCMSFI
jgi:hypothetical protein